ncbi:MAG: diguanylate cyclase, partial [Ectopseudomonas oleovorans]
MKSHPDASARSAAEVVTQLPVPSRLGMLRFERLNEPSWALLFLDPACERQLGISASDLCALVDAPYASLMEPEARYRLHDAIQQQLLQGPHYLVRYTLHTPQGALTLLEMGEPFKQRNRQLLRGYLLVADESLDQFAPAERELYTQNQQLRSSLQQYQRTQNDHLQHLARSHTQQQLIVRLARQRYTSSDPQQEAAELITQAACEVYGVARAGIWKLGGHHLDSVSLYRRDLDRHEQLPSINARNFPQYLQALHSGRAIDAHDAQHDPRTCELAASYLQPLDICSMLDASIRIEGEVVGVLCLEHIGGLRTWQADEIAFAGELADQFAQALINQQKRSATSALHLFQRAVEQSASAFLLVDRDGRVEYVNPSFTAITLYSSDEVCGHRLSELPAMANLSDLLFDAQSSLAEHSSWQ